METLKQISGMLAANKELVALIVLSALVALGYGKQVLAILDAAARVAERLSFQTRNADDTAQKGTFFAEAIAHLHESTKLTKTQAETILIPDGQGGTTVDKKAAVIAALRTPTGKKAQRKVRKFFKKIF